MATTDPLIGATVYNNSDPALGGQQIGDVVSDIVPFVNFRFTSTSTRDSALAAFVAAGGVIEDGMTCWCDSPGSYYDRQFGAWVPRARVIYNTLATDGTTVPATARLVRISRSDTPTVSNTAGAFNISFGFTFTKLMMINLNPGDDAGNLGFIVPHGVNHTLTTAQGIAYTPAGALVPNGTLIRVNVDVIGYIL